MSQPMGMQQLKSAVRLILDLVQASVPLTSRVLVDFQESGHDDRPSASPASPSE
jgi:hypothetical protein